jgi:hypothetical protein
MRSWRGACGLLAVGALALACGGDDEPKPSGAPMARTATAPAQERGDNHAPVVERVVLNPPHPLPGNRIEARVEASDPDGDPIRLSLEWRQQGRVILRGTETSIAPERLAKGQQIEVSVTATDGRDESEPARARVTVGNQAPSIQALYLAPDGEVRPGQDVTAAPQGKDADGDPLEYEFEWRLNGQIVRGADEARFDTKNLHRGDKLQARVRVTDGDDWSPVAESMVLELANSPPRIAGVPTIEPVPGGIEAQLVAEDPDGDRSLRFRVLEGPHGLSVDPVTGRLRWRPDPGAAVGAHPVEIAVADSLGAESALRFELTVAAPAAAPAAAPPAKQRAKADELDEDEE